MTVTVRIWKKNENLNKRFFGFDISNFIFLATERELKHKNGYKQTWTERLINNFLCK